MPLRRVSALLFCSGACALIYQTVWMRQFRLIFGASTGATAAVLAIFMAGLGAGSAVLGRRADAHPRPLAFYGRLELLIASAAVISPLLLWLVAKIYFAAGGSVSLGLFAATILRLLLAAFVLGGATFLMGGTLPAAARAVEGSDDEGRRRVALLYGANTLGAVTGTLASTFFMLEHLGNVKTLLAAVVVNVAIALIAMGVTPSVSEAPGRKDGAPTALPGPSLPLGVTFASAIVGFAFLLMELVWYRMLGPLLGGSTFTFGLILAVALLGIGTGGAAYAFWSGTRPASRAGFAITCALEAAALAIPFALGDRIAVLALYLRPLGTIGFGGFILGWTIVTLIVVFPAAFISGIQFPLLISLLGRGEEGVGRDVGSVYAWNTAGAIAGSLAGGFGLLPLLTATGAWRAVIALLALLSIAAARGLGWIVAIAALALTFTAGPTAVWRHSGIGAGRSENPTTTNDRLDWMGRVRRTTVWARDGRESSVALVDIGDYAFIVNGKADGSARGDAGTQVMAGLVPAILHRNPQSALVVGLGTGSSAGWLGAIPNIKRVDVVELEPAILGIARACVAVNHNVLQNPKVHIRIGDAREVLLATRQRYDIIFSEPSNPYRAGIASLFTREFYEASAARLQAGGLFAQWVQTYDVDAETVRTIYSTLGRVFPHVQTWTTDAGDLLLVASLDPIALDFNRMRATVGTEPFRSALTYAWRVETLEGFVAHLLAREPLARAVVQGERSINTDDRTPIEFGFARGLGAHSRFSMDQLAGFARTRGDDRPAGTGAFDWAAFSANRASIPWVNAVPADAPEVDRARHRIVNASEFSIIAAEWRARPFAPANSRELAVLGEALADGASPVAETYATQLRATNPVDADAILARLRFRQGKPAEASALLANAFAGCRRNPWATFELIGHSFDIADSLATTPALARQLLAAIDQPFAAGFWEDTRRLEKIRWAEAAFGCGQQTLRALRETEHQPYWRDDILKIRKNCYSTTMMPAAGRAERDYDRFITGEPVPFNRDLTPPAPSGSSSGPR